MVRRPCLWLLIAEIGALGSACSHNPHRPALGWQAHDSRNVRVYSETIVEHEYAQEWLENAFHAYANSFFKDLPLHRLEAMFLQSEPGALTRFYFPNDDPPVSWALEGMPGGGRIGKDGLIVLTDRRDFRGVSRQVAYQLINQAIPHAPLWLRLGFAQYLSEYRIHYAGNRWKVCYGTWQGFLSPSHYANLGGLGARAQTIRSVPGRDVLVPLGDVLDADWYAAAHVGRTWFNFTAYAFVSFLIHGRDAWHASRFPLLLQAFQRGLSTADALATAYPHLLPEELDEALADYVKAPRRGVFWQERPDGVCYPIPPGDHAVKKPARSPVDEADVQAALDDLTRMPLWREPGSWYSTDVLLSQSGVLAPTKIKPAPEKASATHPVDQRSDPMHR